MRIRSKAVDLDMKSSELSVEEQAAKDYLHIGKYLNFQHKMYVEHSKLEYTKVFNHIGGFCSKITEGIAISAVIEHLSRYLKAEDFVTLRLVCKPPPLKI